MNFPESIAAARDANRVPVIAEIKRRIPKLADGLDADQRDAGTLARIYEAAGAAAISIVAETRYFGGCPEKDIPAILEATSLPLLIKDFIVDRDTVEYYARLLRSVQPACINRVALLVITHQAGDRSPDLINHIRSLGMLALAETRHIEDLQYLSGTTPFPALVGINNKVIDQLETDDQEVELTPELITAYRRQTGTALIISESAHQGVADVKKSMQAGADAVLVGTAFMRAVDPGATVARFVSAGGAING